MGFRIWSINSQYATLCSIRKKPGEQPWPVDYTAEYTDMPAMGVVVAMGWYPGMGYGGVGMGYGGTRV